MQSFILAATLMSAAVNSLVLPRANICGSTSNTTYTVVAGDTLTTIAEKYSSGICDIASANSISNPNLITPGETLVIPQNCTTADNTSCFTKPSTPTETCVTGPPSTYDVRSGDTLSAIALSFNITLAALEGANSQITNFNAIDVGQIINIPICPDSACVFSTYTIKTGDLFYDLANTYGTTTGQILAANVGVDPTKLAAGQQVVLPWTCRNVTSWAQLGSEILSGKLE